MKKQIIKHLIISIFIVFMISCSSNNKKSESQVEVALSYDNFIDVKKSGETYKIPSPMELFIFLKETKSPFLADKLHNPKSYTDYMTKKARAVNFGIYTADLAYCAVFGDFQKAIFYFNTSQKLADEMGLYEGYGEQIATRVNNNLSNVDSLIEISAESYDLTNTFLEEQGQSDLLGLFLVGGWVEGLYLSAESVKDLDVNCPVIERIADQQLLLENLINYLKENSSKTNDNLIKDLENIQQTFDDLYFNDENTIITQKQFVNISNEVILLRNKYISQM